MYGSLVEAINNHSITLVTGPICSGKSWLLSKLKNESHNIDKRSLALKGGDTGLTPIDFADLVNSSKTIVNIDEAQLIDGKQILDVARFTNENDIKLVIACQYKDSVPERELFQIGCEQGHYAHIELDEFDKKNNQPKSPSIRSTVNFKGVW
ncbi:MAG: hypothetical protein JJV99_06230 [Colwellia sp.]|nr:hypothetical protein [Colwellia sp.]